LSLVDKIDRECMYGIEVDTGFDFLGSECAQIMAG